MYFDFELLEMTLTFVVFDFFNITFSVFFRLLLFLVLFRSVFYLLQKSFFDFYFFGSFNFGEVFDFDFFGYIFGFGLQVCAFQKLKMNPTLITRMLLHENDGLHTYLHSIIEKHEEIGKIETFLV